MWSRFIAVAVVWFVAAGIVKPAPATLPSVIDHEIQDISVAELQANIEMLASDGLSGRGLGHPGNQQAEFYIAHTLQDATGAPCRNRILSARPGVPAPARACGEPDAYRSRALARRFARRLGLHAAARVW